MTMRYCDGDGASVISRKHSSVELDRGDRRDGGVDEMKNNNEK